MLCPFGEWKSLVAGRDKSRQYSKFGHGLGVRQERIRASATSLPRHPTLKGLGVGVWGRG